MQQSIIKEIKDILTTVLETIESDEDTQYDDVADYMEEVSELVDEHFPNTLSKYFEKIMEEAYANKGCMDSTKETIKVMINNIF